MNPLGFLGDIGDVNTAAWEKFIVSQNASLQAAWQEALAARNSLKKVREALGLPFIVNAPGEAGAAGAWNDDFEKNTLEVQAMVTFLNNVTNEAVAGKRALVFNSQTDDMGLELLPTDTLRMAVSQQGRPVMVNVQTGQPVTEFSGTLNALPAVAIVGIVVVAGIVVWASTEAVCDTVKTVAREKTVQTIRTSGAKLIEEGKATPEQVTAMDKGLFEGQASVVKAEAELKEAEDQWPKTLRTVAWVGLGLGALYLAGSLLTRGGGVPALARNPSLGNNPRNLRKLWRVKYGDGGVSQAFDTKKQAREHLGVIQVRDPFAHLQSYEFGKGVFDWQTDVSSLPRGLRSNPLSAWFPRRDQADRFADGYRAKGVAARVTAAEGGYRVVVERAAA